ncbi:GNAT family N-acetyltransferase [Nonomuraea sp. B12E4]|uniref:GNAT family N-acetyltransferase n=1 Tax=Nonomuraea sp. B12E4 TaxID=3153564 RepID=UPI00325F0279
MPRDRSPIRVQRVSRLRWWWTRITTPHAPLRFVYHPPTRPTDLREIYVYDPDDYDIARLVWQVCDECRHGSINKISIDQEWQRRGLGRRLIHRALRDGPTYAWATSGQSPEARKFFPIMSAETGAAFTAHGPSCPHTGLDRRGLAAERLPPPRAVIEHDI